MVPLTCILLKVLRGAEKYTSCLCIKIIDTNGCRSWGQEEIPCANHVNSHQFVYPLPGQSITHYGSETCQNQSPHGAGATSTTEKHLVDYNFVRARPRFGGPHSHSQLSGL